MKRFGALLIAVLAGMAGMSFLTGCSGGGSSGNGSNPGTPGNVSLSFNVAGAQSLVATKNMASPVPVSGVGKLAQALGLQKPSFIFHETAGNPAPGVMRADTSSTTDPLGNTMTNLFSVKPDGTLTLAIQSDFSAQVMYSVLSKDGQYVYIAFTYLVPQINCGIFKVSVADNSYTCLDEGYVPQDVQTYQDYYMKRTGGSIKPIQMDDEGNVYYLGFPQPTGAIGPVAPIPVGPSSAVLRRIGVDGARTTITSDLSYIQSFIVMKNGTLVYTYSNFATADSGIRMYDPASGSTNRLTDDSANMWWMDMFLSVDDKETVIFGTGNGMYGGVYFAQKYGNGGRYVVKLDTSLFSGNSSMGPGYSSSPRRLIIGDDGNLYGLFNEMVPAPAAVPPTSDNYIRVYQILPYDGVPKATAKLAGIDWWAAMNGIDIQISKGYIYFVEQASHPGGIYSARSVIKVVKMSDGGITTLLADAAWNQRYDIYSWKIVGEMIHFSGFDNSTSKMVMGSIDTLKVKNGDPEASYLVINQVASASGASAQVQDMEVIKSQAPKSDTGMNPEVTGLFADPENLHSASVRYSKYMNKDLANAGVHLRRTADAADINAMKVWFYQSQHLIVDHDATASIATVPLDFNTTYQLSVDTTVKDEWNRDIMNIGLSTAFTTRPESGWYTGTSDVVSNITDGKVGKFILNQSVLPAMPVSGNASMRLVSGSTTTNFRVEFSARNRSGWGQMVVQLRDQRQATEPMFQPIVNVTLGAWNSFSSWMDTNNVWQYGNYNTPNVLSGFWSRYRVDMFNTTVRAVVTYADGAQETIFDQSNVKLSASNCMVMPCTDTTAWDLVFQINSNVAEFDDIRVVKLDDAGVPVGDDLINEPFSGATSSIISELTTTIPN